MSKPSTLFEKVWAEHVVVEETPETPAILYIDLHIIHEVTTPQAFSVLRDKGLAVRRPDSEFAFHRQCPRGDANSTFTAHAIPASRTGELP